MLLILFSPAMGDTFNILSGFPDHTEMIGSNVMLTLQIQSKGLKTVVTQIQPVGPLSISRCSSINLSFYYL